MSKPLITLDTEMETVGTVSVSGTLYDIISPSVGDMAELLSLEDEREAGEGEAKPADQIEHLLKMLSILIPKIPKSLVRKLSIKSITKLMEAANAAISPDDEKKS